MFSPSLVYLFIFSYNRTTGDGRYIYLHFYPYAFEVCFVIDVRLQDLEQIIKHGVKMRLHVIKVVSQNKVRTLALYQAP